MSEIQFRVSVPTDKGFLGRECNSPLCKRYFRVDSDCIRDRMHCPYCGSLFSNKELHTTDQIQFLQENAEELAQEYMHKEIDRMFGDLARQFHSGPVQFKYTPSNYRAKPVFPTYREKKVDTELVCPECSFRFQVYGVFGYCPGCGTENMLIYDANLAIIRREIQHDTDSQRALRHAYSDLVSAFELFCHNKASRFDGEKPSFQELFAARDYFKKHAGTDVLANLSEADVLVLRRVFQKRHACIHAGGVITERYVKKIPEDSALLGTRVAMSLDEFEAGAKALRVVMDSLLTRFR